MSEQPATEHSATGICTLAPKRPNADVGLCRACVEQGLFDHRLPQSQLGGLHPELRARITNSRGAIDVFKRETDAFIGGSGERPLFEDHAWRLYTELRLILASIEDIK